MADVVWADPNCEECHGEGRCWTLDPDDDRGAWTRCDCYDHPKLYPLGRGVPPVRLPGGMAAKIEERRSLALHGPASYPPEWPAVAWLVKTMAGWKCERCEHEHDPDPRTGFTLTVHHLDGVKVNLQLWNLAALCQRCHLRVQHRVNFLQDWPLTHRPWMARHVELFNEWAGAVGRAPLSLVGIEARSYEDEWPK
jgi:hypothetical protein